jgi:hypothetical protein
MKAKEHKIEETLSSLENIKRAEANPFLFTRIESKLQISKEVLLKPSLVWSMAACVLVVLSINIFTLSHFAKSKTDINSNALSNEYFSYTKNLPIL